MLTEDMTVFFNVSELATGVTYTANGTTVTAISAIFDRTSVDLQEHDRGDPIAMAEIVVKKSDVTYHRMDSYESKAGEIWHPAPNGIIHEDESIYIIELMREV